MSDNPPALAVYVSGEGSVTAKNLNSFVQGGALVAELRAFTGLPNQMVMLVGGAEFDDGNGGIFGWSASSTAADDGLNVIRPNGLTQGAWLRLAQEFGSLAIGGTQGLTVIPTANPIATLSSLSCQGNAISATTREYLVNFGMTTAVASGGDPDGGAVTLYAGMVANAGCSDVWSFNTVLTMSAGSNPNSAIGYELDFNNNYGDRGNASGGAGLAAPVAYGLAITGAGTHKSTAAVLIAGPGTPIWNRGVVIGSASVSQAAFQDLGTSTISVDVQGSHTYGVDTANSTDLSGAIRLPNNQPGLMALSSGGSDVGVVSMTGGGNDNLYIGADHTGTGHRALGVFICSTSNFCPYTDGTISCGQSGNRWNFVWAVNGTIQTSDPTQKRDIAPTPRVGARIVSTIQPITFGWRMNDGPAHHWGFDAAEVARAFRDAGTSFGGVIPDDDGTLHISPLQMLAALWQHNRELESRLASLEANR